MYKRSVRDWVYIGIFGALWGGVEVSLGSLLHMLFPPLTGTFFTGLILGSIGCIIALTGAGFVPARGTVLQIGLITALIKLIGPGGVKIGPIVAIIAESLLMEAGIMLKRPARSRAYPQQSERKVQQGIHGERLFPYLVAGVLSLSWNLPHRFIMLRILYGKKFVEVAVRMAREGRVLGITPDAVLSIIAVLFIIRMVTGAVSGYAALKLSRTIRRRSLLGEYEKEYGEE